MSEPFRKDHAPAGDRGQKQLVEGDDGLLHLWEDEQPGNDAEMQTTPCEALGHVLSGRGVGHVGDEAIPLDPGTA